MIKLYLAFLLAYMESIAWISKGTNPVSGTLRYVQPQKTTGPSDLVVTVLSQDRRSSGVLLPSKSVGVMDDRMYLMVTYHSIVGDIEPRALVYNLNGIPGNHSILTFTVIGVERSSDLAIAVCTSPGIFKQSYYNDVVQWRRDDDVVDGESVVVVGDSNTYGPHLKSFGVIKKSVFFGSDKTLLVRSRLIDNVSCSTGGSGSGVFVCRRGSSVFAGIVNSRFLNDDADSSNVTIALHGQLALLVGTRLVDNWKQKTTGDMSINYYTISNTIKRSYQKAFLGVLHEYVTVDTINLFPSLANLSHQDDRYSFGGILVTGFVQGFDKTTGLFIKDAISTISPNQCKIFTVLQGSGMYQNYVTNQLPILLVQARYRKYSGVWSEVTERLGQNPGQVGLSEFELCGDSSSPITLFYYTYEAQTWVYHEETLTPSTVTYIDEDNNPIEQSNLAYPYPLYGLETLGSVEYLAAVSAFTAVNLPLVPTKRLQGMNFYFSAFQNKAWESYITAQGGKVVTTVTPSTKYVVGTAAAVKSGKTTDLKKARQLSIPILAQSTAKTRFQLP